MRLPGKPIDNYDDDPAPMGCGMTPTGGFFFFAKCRDTLVAGNLVVMDGAVDRRVKTAPADSYQVVGALAEDVSAGGMAKVIVSGRAPVKLKAGVTPASDAMLYMSDSAGEANICAFPGNLQQREHMIGYTYIGSGAVGGTTEAVIVLSDYRGEESAIQLTDGANIAVPAYAGHHFYVTIDGNRTLSNPTSPRGDMQLLLIRVEQGAGAPFTLAFGAQYRFSAALPSPTLSAVAGQKDYLGFIFCNADTKWDYISQALTY